MWVPDLLKYCLRMKTMYCSVSHRKKGISRKGTTNLKPKKNNSSRKSVIRYEGVYLNLF